jgi:hypothetical protein
MRTFRTPDWLVISETPRTCVSGREFEDVTKERSRCNRIVGVNQRVQCSDHGHHRTANDVAGMSPQMTPVCGVAYAVAEGALWLSVGRYALWPRKLGGYQPLIELHLTSCQY